MMELPISDCLREHYEKHGASFTDSERATIFWNSFLTRAEKLAALREILDTTADESLKIQIQERLDMEAETERAFMSCDSDYIHTVFLDDQTDADIAFASIHAAINYGKENCDAAFRISKMILEDRLEPNADERTLLGGDAEFGKDGTLLCCRCYNSRKTEFVFANDMEPESFEDACIPVLNPFEYGDIVRVMGDSRPALVVTSQERWNSHLECLDRKGRTKNHFSNALTVEFLYPDGEFSHGHPNILALEKVEHWEDEDEWELLQSVSSLMKGDGWIETVLEHYQANKFYKKRGWFPKRHPSA